MPSSSTLIHPPPFLKSLNGSSAPIVVSSGGFHASGAGLLALSDAGVFASASSTAMRLSREADLNEICNSTIAKLPRLWSRVRPYSCVQLILMIIVILYISTYSGSPLLRN